MPARPGRCGAATTAGRSGTRRAARAGEAAFSTRLGGVSAPPYDSLNLGLATGDDAEAVLRNRSAFAAAAGVSGHDLVVPGQIHGTTVAEVGSGERGRGALGGAGVIARTDGLLTREPGLPLFVSFADCVPVLLVAGRPGAGRGPRARRLARHAGRHRRPGGARRGRRGRPTGAAVIGPSIGPCCFAVSPDVGEPSKPPSPAPGGRGASTCGRRPAASSRRAASPPPTW